MTTGCATAAATQVASSSAPPAPTPLPASVAAPSAVPAPVRHVPSARPVAVRPSPRASSASPSPRPAVTPAALARCAPGRLTPALVRVSGAAGSSFALFSLTHSAAVPCTVRGYPALALQDASGRALDVTGQHDPDRPVTEVVLRPGSAAYTATRVSLVACDAEPVAATQVVLSPPGGSGSALRVRPLPVCVGGPIVVTPLAAKA